MSLPSSAPAADNFSAAPEPAAPEAAAELGELAQPREQFIATCRDETRGDDRLDKTERISERADVAYRTG